MMAERGNLRQLIDKNFNAEELKTLCFDLSVDYERFPESKDARVRELIAYMIRTNRLHDLLQALVQQRPNEDWPDAPEPQASEKPLTSWRVRVYHFESLEEDRGEAMTGHHFARFLLRRLLERNLEVDRDVNFRNQNQLDILGFRSAPPVDPLDAYGAMAPFIEVAGYIAPGDDEATLSADVRVSKIDEDLSIRTILLETCQFDKVDRGDMQWQAASMADRIYDALLTMN
jgi:hypothetical protein